jgi:hypothetical protein
MESVGDCDVLDDFLLQIDRLSTACLYPAR